jgi:hypothetical protein
MITVLIACEGCASRSTAIISREGWISYLCPLHAMEYLIPRKAVTLADRLAVSFVTAIVVALPARLA